MRYSLCTILALSALAAVVRALPTWSVADGDLPGQAISRDRTLNLQQPFLDDTLITDPQEDMLNDFDALTLELVFLARNLPVTKDGTWEDACIMRLQALAEAIRNGFRGFKELSEMLDIVDILGRSGERFAAVRDIGEVLTDIYLALDDLDILSIDDLFPPSGEEADFFDHNGGGGAENNRHDSGGL